MGCLSIQILQNKVMYNICRTSAAYNFKYLYYSSGPLAHLRCPQNRSTRHLRHPRQRKYLSHSLGLQQNTIVR